LGPLCFLKEIFYRRFAFLLGFLRKLKRQEKIIQGFFVSIPRVISSGLSLKIHEEF